MCPSRCGCHGGGRQDDTDREDGQREKCLLHGYGEGSVKRLCCHQEFPGPGGDCSPVPGEEPATGAGQMYPEENGGDDLHHHDHSRLYHADGSICVRGISVYPGADYPRCGDRLCADDDLCPKPHQHPAKAFCQPQGSTGSHGEDGCLWGRAGEWGRWAEGGKPPEITGYFGSTEVRGRFKARCQEPCAIPGPAGRWTGNCAAACYLLL